jgi:hypothetical protein
MLLLAVIAMVGIAMSGVGDLCCGPPDPLDGTSTVVHGYGGELKLNFLNDPDVATILADRYGLNVDIAKAGSIEMMCDLPLEGKDFIWAGDQSSLAIYRDCGGNVVRAESVYNSPVVLYTWTPVVDALVASGVARAEAGDAYSVDFAQLVQLVSAGQTWGDIGLTDLHGRITVHTTDPAKSNSGYLFAGLLANSLNDGEVVNGTTVQPLLPDIHEVFGRLGYMEETSGDLFEQFLNTGMGAKPIVAGYESQLLEFLLANPSSCDQVSDRVRILYPRPTVWASHPMVARTENGVKLLDALKDPEIQRLAWVQHGQRPGAAELAMDRDPMNLPGLLENISSVVDMPTPSVMTRILAAIAASPVASPTSRYDQPMTMSVAHALVAAVVPAATRTGARAP